jgi:nitroreductase
MLKKLILKNRSYSRFVETETVSMEILRELVDLSRYTVSAANKQPLKYIISCTPEKNKRIFPHLHWARVLQENAVPKKGERPTAYIIVLGDREITSDFGVDHGIAAQTILLCAVEKELGGCMIGAIDREGLRLDLDIPYRFDILLVIALGKPAETVVIEDLGPQGAIDYWLDKKFIHHVPKRSLDEIIVGI